MKLPRFTAKTGPGRQASSGRALATDIGALTDTGAGAEARALAGLGRSISQVGGIAADAYIKRKALDDAARMGTQTQGTSQAVYDSVQAAKNYDFTMDELQPGDPDYGTDPLALSIPKKEELIKKALADLDKKAAKFRQGFTTEREKIQYNTWYGKERLRAEKDLTSAYNFQHDKYQVDKLTQLSNDAYRSGKEEVGDSYVNSMVKHKLKTPTQGTAMKLEGRKLFATETITGLYRLGLHDEARKVLEDSSLSNKQKEILDDEIDIDERTKIVTFENTINNELVRIDNDPNMTQPDFNAQARLLKNRILAADISGTKRKKMLSDLENWRRGTNEIDYAKILSLNQEMDAAQRSGIVDPTIQTRIMQASLEGAFGGRHKGGQKTYGDMIRRFEKLKFDERVQATASIVRTFERENADDPRLIFLFHQAKNKLIEDNPDADTRELFIKTSGLAESYSILPEREIERKMRTKEPVTVTSQAEYDALKKGTRYKDINGNIGTK